MIRAPEFQLADALAGLSLAGLLLPEAVAYSGLDNLPPQAGVAFYARGATGRLAAARIYDDTDPPIRRLDG
jgi:hypothetical protein